MENVKNSRNGKIKLSVPVIVEGKYDKIAVLTIADATVITTDGFGIFKSGEKRALLRRLSERGLVILCDSDSAGGVIRSHISSFVPKDKLFQLFVPRIAGKEKRKRAPSKEGILGVEGVPTQVLRGRLEELVSRHPELAGGDALDREPVTKMDLYNLGLSGGDGAAAKRDSIAVRAGLPAGMTANSLLAAINMIMDREEFISLCEKI